LDKEKKVMLVSYNALSKEGANGRTLEFLLSGFQKENLAETLYRVLLPNALYTFLLSPLMFGLSYLIARIVRRFSNS
jgi:hypothetical protein